MKLNIKDYRETQREYEKLKIRLGIERQKYLAELKREVIEEMAAGNNGINTDAVKILQRMGYKKLEAENMIRGIEGTTQDIIREALKKK